MGRGILGLDRKKVGVPLYHFFPTAGAFDKLCREEGIPVREDHDTEKSYQQAREKMLSQEEFV
ncbi:hypothetical protein LCGC14_1765140 [marine sediment metagenome]|uniref:Uncharacterized protein n=1 Tax=marine sediment metagenome TaxID=412755 RepID=A0A0F9GZV6_9ZZZZ